MENKRVLIVGSARESGGGVASVIRLMEEMPIWKKYHCYWLGTQIQRNYLWKLWYALKANVVAMFIVWRYDIVHFHTVPDKPGLIIQLPVMLLSLLQGKKTIVHVHMGNQLKDHTENALFKWYLRKTDKVVLLADCFREVMTEGFGVVPYKISVVYNAVSIDQNSKESSCQRSKTIIMAGYFDENKAPDVLLRAIKRLRDDSQSPLDETWRVILMGNGDVEKYKSICHELGLDGVVSFPGYVTGEKKEKIWREASIFCLCSHVEGFPMVVLEAWKYGIPVVTTPVGGLPDVIEEGQNCLTFDFDDIEGLANQLQRLVESEDLRKRMGEYEKIFVKERFSIETANKQLEDLYGSL